ncbi:MAG: DUF5714 domain-containing protein [Chloroflexi bacterium]|nr:DUF5714 domain-containing protein [Chloroflexota bacterium]
MSLPTLPMLGCQHAYIAGGALMAAIKNQGLGRVTNQQIKEVFDRTRKQAHGGYCGLTGVCGIAPAIGACFAVITGSRCGKDTEQRITMEAVTRVSRAIAGLTGPSCCKAYVRTSLATAVAYLKESLAIELPLAETPLCDYGVKHPHGCREFRCPYFKGNGRLEESATASGKATGDLAGSRGYLEKQSRDEDFDYLLKKAVELGAEKAKTPVPFYER